MKRTLKELRIELKQKSRMGAPIIAAGSVYFTVLCVLSFIIEQRMLEFIWVIGIGVIFPLGILLARFMRAELFVKNNSLGALAGIVGGIQGLYIPLYIVLYKFLPEWLPFAIGTLTAAHFIPYIWIYQSKKYGFVVAGMAIVSIVFGSIHSLSYAAVPAGIAFVYGIGAVMMARDKSK